LGSTSYQDEDKPGYAAFGKVVSGLPIARAILERGTGKRVLTPYETSIAPDWFIPQLLNENVQIIAIVRLPVKPR